MNRIGFLAFPEVEELDLIGPWEMATMWAKYADGPEAVVVAETTDRMRCAMGFGMFADHGFDDCPPLDALLIPGGYAAFDEMNNPALIDFVKRTSANCEHILSVCSGSFILLKAGLLDGKKATTHWKVLTQLKDAGVEVIEERYVRDGNIWTSAGVSAGIDLMLHFIAEVAGQDVAGAVQNNSEYYPEDRRYGDYHRAAEMPAYMKRLE